MSTNNENDDGALTILTTETPPVSPRLLEALVCPSTGGRLTYDADRQELISKSANLAYPIRQGIPIMLVDEARTVEE